MAFQHHSRQAVHRPFAQEAIFSNESLDHATPAPSSNVLPVQTTVEPQTWVLFSPTTAEDVTTTCGSVSLSSLAESQQTPGRSQISDLGSVNNLGRQNYALSLPESIASRCHVTTPSVFSSSLSGAAIRNGEQFFDEDGEDDAELDSLDSHLADFRAIVSSKQINPQKSERHGGPHTKQQAVAAAAAASAVHLPAHDGLGSFQLGWTGDLGASLQERLYAFERFNPRRVVDSRRRESLDLAQLQIRNEYLEELERIKRIEAWQLDQSSLFLGEIQKETRRRRDSHATRGVGGEDAVALSVDSQDGNHGDIGGDWHEQEEDEAVHGTKGEAAVASSADKHEAEGLWSRLTRKFMLEVMGIDDHVLSILFGESLANADDPSDEANLRSTTRTAGIYLGAMGSKEADQRQGMQMDERDMVSGDADSTWQYRVLQNIAKELGLLVHRHIATAHPGAFSIFQQVQQSPLPYAGLPMIPESTGTARLALNAIDNGKSEIGIMEDVDDFTGTAAAPFFEPTIKHMKQQQAELPHDYYADHSSCLPSPVNTTAPAFTQDEWEQDLDIKLVFRYLRSRFLSGGTTAPSHGHHQLQHPYGLYGKHNSGASSTMSTQDVAAKVARVRQHHPLIGRNAARQAGDRRPMLASRNMAGLAAQSATFSHRHPHGTSASWANQSSRRSARRASVSSRQSSRHYWDIGGSVVGTGSVIASVGPMGSWGDV